MDTSPDSKITALIITYNEMGYIEACLESLGFADEIIVVDSFSTDGTFNYLQSVPGLKVIQHPFENFTIQKTFALSLANYDWVLFLDADEVIPQKLGAEILSTVQQNPTHVAFWVYRKFMFKKKRLRFSGWQTDKNYRLFRKSKARFKTNRLVHETLELQGTSGKLREKLIHFTYKNYRDYRNKMIRYGRLKAQEEFQRGQRFLLVMLILKPLWKFVNHYFIRLGILDGQRGIIICYLNALGVYERCVSLRKLSRTHQASRF
ncbi:MAG: hypothetical protein RLZZ241_1294 [Bacteroidota bacterium]|jgi:glycosyltransferase involved in cell wall biosynthesis